MDHYSSSVFLNCPFDAEYKNLRDGIVFAIFDCGFQPRSALEDSDSGDIRFDKIRRIIEESRFGIHDISRTELDESTQLPRFNMPLELGFFLGAKRFGDQNQRRKVSLVLDVEQYRYQKFISDISGCDIAAHSNQPKQAITEVRNWLNNASRRRTIPGGQYIYKRFVQFKNDLPALCKKADVERNEVTYNDYCTFASEWLRENKNL